MQLTATALYQALLADLANVIDVTLPGWAPDSDPQSVACYCLRDSLLKKFNEEEEPSLEATDAALANFLAVNDRCATWSIPYEFSQDEMLIGGVKQCLYEFWYDGEGLCDPLVSDWRDVFNAGRTGPGASVGARDSDFYTKMFDSPMSYTSRAGEIWRSVTPVNGLWAEAEAEALKVHGFQISECSRLSFVKKKREIARDIGIEPTANMWLQLGFGNLLRGRLRKRFGIDLGQQPDVNRVMARRGSVDGSVATIDLKDASNSIGYNTFKGVLPRSFFGVIDALRTTATQLPDLYGGSQVTLHMVSTMGNGFTFPLQTAIFASIVQSVYRYMSIPFVGWGSPYQRTFSVFGDDIIVDTRAVPLVLRTLYLLGFRTNSDKTFVTGRFRESCGADYVDGISVRGVYVKSLRTLQDLFVAVNTLIRWSAKTGVSLRRTIGYLLSGIRKPHLWLVPTDEDDAAGIHCPLSFLSSISPENWPRDRKGRLKNPYPKTRNGLTGYRCRVPQKWEFIIIGGYVWTYKGQKRRRHLPASLEVAFLAGTVRGYRVSLRQKTTLYSTRRKYTPSWGYLPPRPHETPHGASWDRLFVEACERCFVSDVFGAWAN